jgi:hypothetical protein
MRLIAPAAASKTECFLNGSGSISFPVPLPPPHRPPRRRAFSSPYSPLPLFPTLSLGKQDEVERTRGCLEDRMLSEWVRQHLLPRPSSPAASAAAPPRLPSTDPAGLVLRTSRTAEVFTLNKQFMHKAIVLIVKEDEGRGIIGAVRHSCCASGPPPNPTTRGWL